MLSATRRLSPSVRTAVVLGTNLVLGMGALVWVLYRYGAVALETLAANPSPIRMVAFLGVVAAGFAVFSRRWQTLLRADGITVPLLRLIAFRAAGTSVAGLVPSGRLGGEPLRAWLATRDGIPASTAIATIAIDRVLEVSAGSLFACTFLGILLAHGVPQLGGAVTSKVVGAIVFFGGVALVARRLRRGAGVVAAMVRATGLDHLATVRGRLDVLAETDATAADLLGRPALIGRAFAIGVVANVLVLVECHFLLAALGLPAGPLPVVAALFATGFAHSLPVPAAIGVLEGAQLWLFDMLGYPPGVGLAVALAVRARELVYLLPGLLYLIGRGLRLWTLQATLTGLLDPAARPIDP